jgi:hypothetical protein
MSGDIVSPQVPLARGGAEPLPFRRGSAEGAQRPAVTRQPLPTRSILSIGPSRSSSGRKMIRRSSSRCWI